MSEKLYPARPIYPLIGLIASIMIMIFGLISAKKDVCLWFLCAIWVLFLLFGYWKACLAVIPFAGIMCLILAGITYAISREVGATVAAVNRILAICIAVIPGLALPPVNLVRNFSALKMPRMLTLAMMITLNFFPLLKSEVSRVREAMKTRGAGNLFQPQVFYRAFLIPLIMRLVNISDTLALSVETRGFTTDKVPYTVYKTVKVHVLDIFFIIIVTALSLGTVIL